MQQMHRFFLGKLQIDSNMHSLRVATDKRGTILIVKY
jgi:hypothetical protein